MADKRYEWSALEVPVRIEGVWYLYDGYNMRKHEGKSFVVKVKYVGRSLETTPICRWSDAQDFVDDTISRGDYTDEDDGKWELKYVTVELEKEKT